MKSALILALCLTGSVALAQDAPIGLAEALTDAQAVAAMDQGFIFISKSDAAYVCAVNMSPAYFGNLAAGDAAAIAATQPQAICVLADAFKLLGTE